MSSTLFDPMLPDLWRQVMQHGEALFAVLPFSEPWFALLMFSGASVLMIWRLGALEKKGLEGTVLGTLVMPYASGFSNLTFAYILGRSGGDGILVLENCLVNNVTNLTLLIGLPAMFWSLTVFPGKQKAGPAPVKWRAYRLNHLSLQMTLLAALFFTGALWALARDGVLDFGDGLVLIGMFLFWQLFQIFDVLKYNVHRGRSLRWSMIGDIALITLAGVGVYQSIDALVEWIPRSGSGLLVFDNIGWLSGLLMVVPNAFLAIYYAMAKRADIVYSSQVGDGHICIPMCIGLFALFAPIRIPDYFDLGVFTIVSAGALHLFLIAFWGRLPRSMGFVFSAAYLFFIYKGILS
jgi:cation:H+ antiporter